MRTTLSALAIDVEAPEGAVPFDVEPLTPTTTPTLPWPGDLALRAFSEAPDRAPWAREAERRASTVGPPVSADA